MSFEFVLVVKAGGGGLDFSGLAFCRDFEGLGERSLLALLEGTLAQLCDEFARRLMSCLTSAMLRLRFRVRFAKSRKQ